MRHGHCMKTVMGGLSLVLILSACSSGSKSKTTSAPPSGDMSRSDDMRRGATPTISPPTDLPRSDVVTDRGTSRRTISDPTDRARLSDRSPEIAAACPSRTDAQGTVIFEDPTCPDRYRSQLGNTGNTSERDRAGLAAACSSRPDANGKIIYDDPACPDRYRRQASAMSSIREARVRLSRAAGIKVWDTAADARVAPRAQTIKGELSRRENPSGGEHYVVRDSQNREMPISLSPEMSRQVQVGDVVEAQVDSSGQVTSISKAR